MIRRLGIAGGLLLSLLTAGTLGYVLIEGWGVREALFMTVITIATVGFGEVHPLSPTGQIFTIFLIIASVGALGFSLGVFVDFIAEGRLRKLVEGRRMRRAIGRMSDHFIVAGAGKVGSAVADSLADNRAQFVLIDWDEEPLRKAADRGWITVFGDATRETALIEAGVERAGSLITTLPSDGGNMFVTVTAKTVNPGLFVVSLSEFEDSEPALLKAGADRVTTPNVIGGRRMATLAMHPFTSDYLDLVSHGQEVQFRLQDVEMRPDSPLAGKTIRQEAVRDRYGTYILAIRHPDGSVDTNPSMDTVMLPGSILVVLGTPEQIDALSRGA